MRDAMQMIYFMWRSYMHDDPTAARALSRVYIALAAQIPGSGWNHEPDEPGWEL